MQVFITVAFMSFADIVTTEECGKEVCKPNPAHIPAGKMFNFYAHTT